MKKRMQKNLKRYTLHLVHGEFYTDVAVWKQLEEEWKVIKMCLIEATSLESKVPVQLVSMKKKVNTSS